MWQSPHYQLRNSVPNTVPPADLPATPQTRMASHSDRKRSRTSTLPHEFESLRSIQVRTFKHTAISEMIDLIEHKCPWKRETRQKVVDIARQVIDDLEPFSESPYDPFQRNIKDVVSDLRSVIGMIDTPVFQVVKSYEAMSLLKLVRACLKAMDPDISISDDEEEDDERPKSPDSECNFIRVNNGSIHLILLDENLREEILREDIISESSLREEILREERIAQDSEDFERARMRRR